MAYFLRKNIRKTVQKYHLAMDTLHFAFGLPGATKENIFSNPPFGTELVMYKFGQGATTMTVLGIPRVAGLDRSRADYPYNLETAFTPPLRPAIIIQ
jgi:hypothetical protein